MTLGLIYLFSKGHYRTLIHQLHLEFTDILGAESHVKQLYLILALDFRGLLANVVRWGMKNVAFLVGICPDEVLRDNSIIST